MREIALGKDNLDTVELSEDARADRRGQLVAALLLDDVLALMDASNAELNDLGNDEDLLRSIPDSLHVLHTVAFWKYMRKEADASGRPFVLPDAVRTNLHWKTPIEPDPYAHTYGII